MSQKGWITFLLAVCCAAASVLHVQVEPGPEPVLHSPTQLDSLIAQTTYDFRLSSDQVRIQTVTLDSIFQRKIYRMNVAPGFSKTTFHHHLNTRLAPLNVSVFGTVEFPEKNLKLNVLYNNTVQRTLHIESDPGLTRQPAPIPRLPD